MTGTGVCIPYRICLRWLLACILVLATLGEQWTAAPQVASAGEVDRPAVRSLPSLALAPARVEPFSRAAPQTSLCTSTAFGRISFCLDQGETWPTVVVTISRTLQKRQCPSANPDCNDDIDRVEVAFTWHDNDGIDRSLASGDVTQNWDQGTPYSLTFAVPDAAPNTTHQVCGSITWWATPPGRSSET